MDVFDLVAKISLDTRKYEASLVSAEAKGKGFAASLGSGLQRAAKIGSIAIAGVTGATAILTGKIVKSAQAVAEYGDEVDKTSQKMGLSAEAYQKWNYVLNLAGTEMSSMTTGLKTLTNQIDDAKSGSEDAQKRFERLGISMDDLNKMSREEVFERVIKGFQGMADSTDRAALANDLFGRSGQNLAPLFNQSAEKTEEQIKLAERYGMVMPEAAVKASAAFKDSMTTMQMTMTGFRNRLMGDFLPSLTQITDGISKLFAGENGGDDITRGLESFVTKLTEKIPRIVQIISDVLPKVIGELSPLLIEMSILLVTELVRALPQILDGLAQTLPEALADVFDRSMTSGVVTMLTMFTLGFNPLVKLISKFLGFAGKGIGIAAKLFSAIGSGISFVTGFISILNPMLLVVIGIIGALVAAGIALYRNWDTVKEKAVNLWMSAVESFNKMKEGISAYLDEVKQRATEAWNAITQTVQENIQIAVDAVNGALEWLSNLWENMKEVGKRIVEGIWEGMKGATEWLKELIKGWVGNVTEFLKWLFGINSPSTVMRDQIGKFLPEGIAVGIEANADAVYDEMDAMREKVAEPFDVSVIGTDGIHSSQSLRMDDSGIVTAINEVKDYIDKLQVVLSTGETVGALTPYIDSALGRTQAIKAMGG